MTTSVTSSGSSTTTTSAHSPGGARGGGILHQPKAVWAVAFASVIAFMGIGLVDPILQPIAEKLHASPPQVSLLFTSYMAVTGIAMLVTGVISSRIGSKRTMQGGLALIVVFSALAGSSNTIGQMSGSGPAGVSATLCSSRPARSSAGCSAASAGAGRSSGSPC